MLRTLVYWVDSDVDFELRRYLTVITEGNSSTPAKVQRYTYDVLQSTAEKMAMVDGDDEFVRTFSKDRGLH